MRIRLPSKKIRERFFLVYELKGCQKAVDFLTKYYGVRRMRIRLNGRKVGNGDIAVYFENKAYFTKRGLAKSTILHELYHHLVYTNDLDIAIRKEEKEANQFAKKILNRSREVVVHQRNSKRLILQRVR
jgi:Zn-dependent peptidase ImmA (M78 family)